MVRHGHVVAEGWWGPYDAQTPHIFYSLSKSFTSTAVGLAVAEGKLSVDDEVLKFFPEYRGKRPWPNWWRSCNPVNGCSSNIRGLDTPEMRGIGHKGYENVAADRAGMTHAFTSSKVKEAIARRKIKLIGYDDIAAEKPSR